MKVSDIEIREYFAARERYDEEELDIPELTLEQKLDLMDAMYQLSVELGKFPPEDPLEGIETKIELARIINSVSTTP
ncbi:MAG: hypothetical protein MAGBODY4_01702 [Candidatus Marinimicrobia bacterium]|nr:hypothetical protein [Candidatus Neomarinimicrobiota bacterium]